MKKIFILILASTITTAQENSAGFFEKLKDNISSGISGSYDYIKSKINSKKYEDNIREIEKTVELDFEHSQKEVQEKFEENKNALKKGEKIAQEVIDKFTDKSKIYFEENKDKFNVRWDKLNKKLITLQEKISSIQNRFNQVSITYNLLDNVDAYLITIKQIPATRRARNNVSESKVTLNYLRELTTKIYDEFEEELDDLIEEIQKYESKVENKFNDAENKSRIAINSTKEAIKRVSK